MNLHKTRPNLPSIESSPSSIPELRFPGTSFEPKSTSARECTQGHADRSGNRRIHTATFSSSSNKAVQSFRISSWMAAYERVKFWYASFLHVIGGQRVSILVKPDQILRVWHRTSYQGHFRQRVSDRQPGHCITVEYISLWVWERRT